MLEKSKRASKELQGRNEEMEEDLEAKRQTRNKAERQRSDLARVMESLGERLHEASGTTVFQLKLAQREKAKAKATPDAANKVQQLDQVQIMSSTMEKKAKQFDRIVGD